jgi:hypothetical protein
MNALPQAWHALIQQHAAAPLVLIDGALQQPFGQALARDADGALSLFAQYSNAAQALGPWLMTEARAASLGITGCAHGVNWIATTRPLQQVLTHLLLWMRGPDPASRTWKRLADARALNAMIGVWTGTQREAFCQPWLAWCYADRNGSGRLLDLPLKRELLTPVSTVINAAQKQQLDADTAADRLIQELKAITPLHASMKGCREQRHAVIHAVIKHARNAGYEDEDNLVSFVAWALRTGIGAPDQFIHLSAVKQRLSGEALWYALDKEADACEIKQ